MTGTITDQKINHKLYNDVELFKKLIPAKQNKTLFWDMDKPYIFVNGVKKKNQYWKNLSIDYEKHIRGELNQGGNLCYIDENGNKVAKASVCDVDTPLAPEKFCKILFSEDPTAIPFRSPSGENWHVWKFHKAPLPVEEAHKWTRDIGFKLEEHGFKIDFGKCNPSSSGSDIGINFPFNNDVQVPYDPRGKKYTEQQFKARLRFNSIPYIASVIGLETGKNRYDALLYSCVLLHQYGKYKDEYCDEIIESFGTKFDDKKKIEKLKGGEFKKYSLKHETIEKKIAELIGYKDFKFEKQNIEIKKEEKFKLSKITTGEEVWSTEDKPVNQIIDGYFCEGLTVVAGRPKGGKSWLMLNASLSVESELQFLGQAVQKSRCLYYALEDNNARMKRRWKALGMKQSDPKPDVIYLKDLENKLGEGLEKEIEIRIQQSGYKLVVIDTFAKAKSEKINLKTQYDVDTKSLTGLQEVGLKYGVAIVVVHHTRKPDRNNQEQDEFDAISGTSGIQGVADTLIVLTSKRKKEGTSKLFLVSRDLEPLEKEVSQNADFWWEVIGEASEDNAGKNTLLQNYILEAVKWWTKKPVEWKPAPLDGEHHRPNLEEDAIKKIPKNDNVIEACTPKQICEYFVIAKIKNIRGEDYKVPTIKKETQRMRDVYSLLDMGKDPHTYRLPVF